MKTEIILYEKKESVAGCFSILGGFIILFLMFWIFNEESDQVIIINILFSITGTLITFLLVVFYTPDPEKILSISEKGMYYHLKNAQIEWENISEIQIIDSQLSVTVDSEPEKDFKLALHATDFFEGRMTIDDIVKLINRYYKKNIYTYTSPPSCGCC